MKSLWLAVGFLTAVPARSATPGPGDLGRAAVWFPPIGLLVGAILAAAHYLLGQVFSPVLAAALVVALWATLTGGLHLDGLADCCDGLLAAAAPDRRLEIMRDPRLGAFGGVGLTLFLILKILAVASLPYASRVTVYALLFSPALARWLVLLVATQPSARPGGMGADFALGLTRSVFVLAALIPLALIVVGLLFTGAWQTVIATALAHLVAIAAIRLARARLGGVTGDVFGLTVELAELTVLLTFAARLPAVP